MIVKCERCQTRFKIPDEKVTDKGVKVRCTKCQHTFRVVREDASSATPAPTPPAEVASFPKPAAPPRAPATAPSPPVPWSNASPAAKPAGRPAGASPLDSLFDAAGSPPAAPSGPGVAFPRGGTPSVPTPVPRATGEPSRTPATMDLDPLMEFIGDNTPTPAQALQLTAKAPVPNKPTAPAAPRAAPASPKPAVTPKPAMTPKPAQGAASVPVPARSAPQAPAPRPAPSPVPVPARSPAPQSSAPASFEENDPFSLPPNDPFSLPPDDGATLPATPTLPRSNAPASFEENDPFSLPASEPEPFDALEGNNPFVSFDAAPTVPATPTLPPAPAPKPARSAAPAPIPAPDEEMEGLEGNNPFMAFDPVAALPPAPAARSAAPSPAPSAIPDWGAPQQAAPSAIPDWGAPQTVAATPTAKAEAPTERNPFPLPDFPGPGAAPPSREVLPDLPALAPTPAPPVVAAEPAKKEQGSLVVRRLATVAAQTVVVAVLVLGLVAVGMVWLNDGRMELRELVSPTRPLVAKELSNGLYELRGGHNLFYVRGAVENRGTAPVRVKAQVALYEGEQRVKSAEGLVGAVPTPEELYSLQNVAEADALRARLDAAATEVAPGARAPFVILFYEYPSDLGSYRLEVTFETQGAGTAAGGAREGSAGNAQP